MNEVALGTSINHAREHYDSAYADRFYHRVWANEDADDVYIGLGVYNSPDDPIAQACLRTVEKMAGLLSRSDNTTRVLELGSGYGAAARYLAREKGFQVDCLNLSTVQNAQNRARNAIQGLAGAIRVMEGNFEALEVAADSYEVVWSQDAFVHSGNRLQIFSQVDQVLAPNGDFVFTDLLQGEDCSPEDLQPVLDRFHLASLGSFSFYRETAQRFGWHVLNVIDLSPHVVTHYQRVLHELKEKYTELLDDFSPDYLDTLGKGMQHWISAGEQGTLQWGLFHLQKP